jgi:hypothetical protein
VQDVKVGNTSQLVSGGEVPAALFTEVAIGYPLDVGVRWKHPELGPTNLSKLFLRRLQTGLRATRHQDARTAIKEHLRRCEPHAARAADNHDLFYLDTVPCVFS